MSLIEEKDHAFWLPHTVWFQLGTGDAFSVWLGVGAGLGMLYVHVALCNHIGAPEHHITYYCAQS